MNDYKGYRRLARALADKQAQDELDAFILMGYSRAELVFVPDPKRPGRRMVVPLSMVMEVGDGS